jgi:hypothetical protein
MDTYLGYKFVKGKHHGAEYIEGPEAAVKYVVDNKDKFDEVMVTDDDDCVVMHAIDGKVVFPGGLGSL